MEISRCNEFLVLAKTRNYLEASEQLNISQSTLSKHIQALERELGATLFDRSTRRVSLSDDGVTFLPFAERIVRVDYELHAALGKGSPTQKKTLAIGSIPVMSPYGITKLLAGFERTHPAVRLNIVEGDATRLKQQMRRGELELAFIREWDWSVEDDEGDEDFHVADFASDEMVAALPLTHPLAGAGRIGLADLASEDFLLLPEGSVMYALCLDACQQAGFTPSVRYNGSRADNIIDLVANGMGVSLLMRKPASHIADGRVALVDVEPTITTYVKLYRLRGRRLSPEAKQFFSYVADLRH